MDTGSTQITRSEAGFLPAFWHACMHIGLDSREDLSLLALEHSTAWGMLFLVLFCFFFFFQRCVLLIRCVTSQANPSFSFCVSLSDVESCLLLFTHCKHLFEGQWRLGRTLTEQEALHWSEEFLSHPQSIVIFLFNDSCQSRGPDSQLHLLLSLFLYISLSTT